MKSLFSQSFITIFILSASIFSACKKDSNNPSNADSDLATVTTDKVEGISYKSASIVSTVSKEGKSAVSGMGIAYGKNPNPTVVADSFIPRPTFGVGTFSSNLTNLEVGTTYYVRSYATNSFGTAYSEQKTFTTLPGTAPTIATAGISSIMLSSAKGGGTISIEGSSAIVERGLVWSTSPGPTLTSSGKVSSTTGTNTFELSITGLIPNTLYYVRAYATNGELTSYGNEVSFTTLDGVIDIDGNVSAVPDMRSRTQMMRICNPASSATHYSSLTRPANREIRTDKVEEGTLNPTKG